MEIIVVFLFGTAIICLLAVYFNRIMLALYEILKILRREFRENKGE